MDPATVAALVLGGVAYGIYQASLAEHQRSSESTACPPEKPAPRRVAPSPKRSSPAPSSTSSSSSESKVCKQCGKSKWWIAYNGLCDDCDGE